MSKRNHLPNASEAGRPQTQSDVLAAAPQHDQIAALAYDFWQRRGCPIGSPDEDWAQAEAALQRGKKGQKTRTERTVATGQ
jgi:hypothetical protein